MCSVGRGPPGVQRNYMDRYHRGCLEPGGARRGRRDDHQQAVADYQRLVAHSGCCKDSGRTGNSTSSSPSVGHVQAAADGVESLPESIVTTTRPQARTPGPE